MMGSRLPVSVAAVLSLALAVSVQAEIIKFDMGTEASQTWPGFTKVTHRTVHSPEQRYGWKAPAGKSVEHKATNRAKNVPDVLACDIVAPGAPFYCYNKGKMEFLLDVPNGDYGVYVMTGDYTGAQYQWPVHVWPLPPSWSIATEGEIKAHVTFTKENWPKQFFRHLDDDYRKGQDIWDKLIAPRFVWTRFSATVADGRLNLLFTNTPVNALVVYPLAEAKAADSFIAELDKKRKASFPLSDRTPRPAGELQTTPEDAQRGYALFFPNYLQDIRPFDLPRPEQLNRELRAFATLGEFEPVVFVVRPLKELKGCAVQVSDLRSEEGAVIKSSCWDVRVVRYIETALYAGRQGGYTIEPLVLLRRERSDLDEGINKQFWLTIKVPEDAKPGKYKGTVSFRPANAPATKIPLKLLVLPFRLRPLEDSGRYQGNWWNSTKLGVDLERVARDLKDHGMNVIHTPPRPTAELVDGKIVFRDVSATEQFLDTYRKTGFPMKLIVWQSAVFQAYALTNEPRHDEEWLKALKARGGHPDHQVKKSFGKQFEMVHKQLSKATDDLFRQRGWPEIYFYESGEGGSEGYWGIWTETQLLRMLKEAGVKGTTSVIGSAALEAELPYLHAAQLYVRDATSDVMRRIREAGVRLWLYGIYGSGHESRLRGPDGEPTDRFLRGFWFWKTGAEGCAIEGYIGTYGDPFDELDGRYRHEGRIFPTPDGPAPTPSWERIREGVDDARYIGHLDLLIRGSAKSANPAVQRAATEARVVLDDILAQIPPDFPACEKGGLPWISEYDVCRWRIADQIMRLRAAIGGRRLAEEERRDARQDNSVGGGDIDAGAVHGRASGGKDRAAPWWNRDWRYRVRVQVPPIVTTDAVTVWVNFADVLKDLGPAADQLDTNSLRVLEVDEQGNGKKEIPFLFEERIGKMAGWGWLTWPGSDSRLYEIYFDSKAHGPKEAPRLQIPRSLAAQCVNLVPNPSFEEPNPGEKRLPADWTFEGQDLATGKWRSDLDFLSQAYAWSQKEARSGRKSMKFSLGKAVGKWKDQVVSTLIPAARVPPLQGRRIHARVFAYLESGSGIVPIFIQNQGEKGYIKDITARPLAEEEGKWVPVVATGVIDEKTLQLQVRFSQSVAKIDKELVYYLDDFNVQAEMSDPIIVSLDKATYFLSDEKAYLTLRLNLGRESLLEAPATAETLNGPATEVKVEFKATPDESLLKNAKVRLAIAEKGRRVATQELPAQKESAVALPIASLKAGNYTLIAELLDDGGKPLLSVSKPFRRIAGPFD